MSDYDWIDDDAFCVTFVRGLTPREALSRFPTEVFDGDDEEGDYEEGLVSARPAEGGAILSEWNGFAGTLPEILSRLSSGTVTASVFRNVNMVASFVHYADGQEVLAFDWLFPDDDASGAYLAERTELGLAGEDAEGDLPQALKLAERITGVRANGSSETVAAHCVFEHY
ncbi:DUF6461 domain-containing protein [Streptosporangium sp. NPDC000509]|uniref:DUF6461 domain-containing protein n=1 Tax=Streptosporangium sp. NPDC000509 TaxID=3366186 RepID=UPI00369056B4